MNQSFGIQKYPSLELARVGIFTWVNDDPLPTLNKNNK